MGVFVSREALKSSPLRTSPMSEEMFPRTTGGDCIAIVPAAGSSSRFGQGRAKIFAEVGGVAVLKRTVETLASVPSLRHLVVLSPAAEVQAVTLLLNGIPRVSVVVGGATRQESVARGLEHARSEHALKDEEYVLVHDAARCLVSKELVERTLAAAREFKAVTTAISVVDTISVRGIDGSAQTELPRLISTLDRNTLVAIQTPQVFRADLLLGAHESYRRASQRGEATDDAMLVRTLAEVRIVEGDPRNIKVTRPFDVAVAEALLREDF